MKPHFKLNVDGSATLLSVGRHGMNERELAQYMIRVSGSTHKYALRHRLPADLVRAALDPANRTRNDSRGAMRALLGLSWKPKLPSVPDGYRRGAIYRQVAPLVIGKGRV